MMNEHTDICIRNLAHLGDAVYELFIREFTAFETQNPKRLHKLTVFFVNAGFQTEILEFISEKLTETEQEITRRARNIPVTAARRVNQKLHRTATAFEALVGHLYLHDKTRLNELFEDIKIAKILPNLAELAVKL